METTDKYHQLVAASKVSTDDAAIKVAVDKLLAEKCAANKTLDTLKFLLNTVDLTTLSSTDTATSVMHFTERVNRFEESHPELKNVAAICVYAKWAEVVRNTLEVDGVDVAVCSANFPSSQAKLEVKVAETALAVADGADEVDVVFNLGLYCDDDFEGVYDEVAELKAACKDALLKVILEVGALKTAQHVLAASILSMHAGCDFIKTSTGKIYDGANPYAAYVMCQAIKEYHELTGRKVGFKVSGGVRTSDEAVAYYTIVKEVLGQEWLNNKLFRIGASSLANNLVRDITGDAEAKPF